MNRCARFKGNVSPDSITEQHSELFEMPDGHFRLNEFINRFVVRMSGGERLQLLKILLAHLQACTAIASRIEMSAIIAFGSRQPPALHFPISSVPTTNLLVQ